MAASVVAFLRFFISYYILSLPNLGYVLIPTEETNEEMRKKLKKKKLKVVHITSVT